MRFTLSPGVFEVPESENDSCLRVRSGQRVRSTEALRSAWVNLGYRHEPVVESPGTFSLRGGIIDVFPPQAENPFRLELWDDEVDTIRAFDPFTQRSLPTGEGSPAVQHIDIIPAREQLPELADRASVEKRIGSMDFSTCTQWTRERFEEELVELFSAPNVETLSFYNGLLNHHNLLDYLPSDGLLILDRESQMETEALDLEEKFFRMRESRETRGDLPRQFPIAVPFLGTTVGPNSGTPTARQDGKLAGGGRGRCFSGSQVLFRSTWPVHRRNGRDSAGGKDLRRHQPAHAEAFRGPGRSGHIGQGYR